MKKALIFILILTLISTVFTGCGKNEDIEPNSIGDLPEDAPDIEDIPSIEETKIDKDDFYESEEETAYTMVQEDGSTIYLQEESPGIVKLQMAVAKYGELQESVDYRTTEGKEIYPILTAKGKKAFEEAGIPQIATEHYNEFKIIKHFEGVEKYDSIVFEGDTAIVDVDIAFVYQEVEGLANYEVGTTYYRPKTLEFKIVDGEWLLNMDLDTGQIYHVADED